MMESSGCAPRKLDRKSIEKNRRIYMKSLYSTLENLLLLRQTKDIGFALSASDCITEAADYITELKQRVEKLRDRKQQLLASDSTGTTTTSALTKVLPCIEIQDISEHLKAVKINLQASTSNAAGLYNTVRLLEEEGVEVLNALLAASGSVSEAPVHDIHLLLGV